MRLPMVLLVSLMLVGCSSGVFKVPKDTYRSQVKTLGILPIMVDAESPIGHSQGTAVVSLLRRTAIGKLESAIETLRKKKGYFDVRYVGVDPQQVMQQLIVARMQPQQETGLPTGYYYSATAAKNLADQKVVDALLVVVLAGVEHEEKRRSRNKLETLTTVYNDIMATAAVVGKNGKVLWEMSGADAVSLLQLQYPDFDEAHFNRTDVVALKEITLGGLERALTVEQQEGAPPQLPEAYQVLIDRLIAGLSPNLFGSL